MHFRRMGVFGDSAEQFGTHEKLSSTSNIYVNCMKRDPIDLIFYFTLSKALLILIYIVSIWCMASIYMCFVVTCWERADLLALVCGVCCEFVTFPLVSWVRCGS